MSPRDLEEIRRLEQRARELRQGRTIDSETQRHNAHVANGLRLTGDVIRWMQTDERPGAEAPIDRRARTGVLVEDLGLESPSLNHPTPAPAAHEASTEDSRRGI